MKYSLIFKLIGSILNIQALFMLVPLAVSFIYGSDDKQAFLLSVLITAATGFLLSRLNSEDKKFRTRDAFAAAALTWIIISFFGALPYFFSGYFASFADCMFESVSGFTTTGATILSDIESLPKGIIFWRNFTHLIGGMGVLMFMLAVMPSMNASSVNLLRAESSGISPDKIVPKLRETARVIYLIYLSMAVLLTVLLILTGLPVFDSLMHAFSIAGTGGFSNKNLSAGAYNNAAAEIIMTVFMFLFGINFTLYFYLFNKKFQQFIKDEELRLYFLFVIISMVVVTINISGLYDSWPQALRHASFQVSSIITSTGFSTTDYNLWPVLSHFIFTFLMFTGCCAGSTGGGIKIIRFLLLFKLLRIELDKIIHPRSVRVVTINGKRIDNEVASKASVYFFIYFMLFFIAVIPISMEGLDIVASTSAIIAMLSNIGPGLGVIGPTGNYGDFSAFSKFLLSFYMIIGRLEFIPVLILLKPSVWLKGA